MNFFASDLPSEGEGSLLLEGALPVVAPSSSLRTFGGLAEAPIHPRPLPEFILFAIAFSSCSVDMGMSNDIRPCVPLADVWLKSAAEEKAPCAEDGADASGGEDRRKTAGRR